MNKNNLFVEQEELFINSTNIDERKNITNSLSISSINLNKEQAKKIHRHPGLYTTIFYSKKTICKEIDILINVLSNAIDSSIKHLKISGKDKILFVGIGNKLLTTDKLGYMTIEKIVLSKNHYKTYKNVEALTNINTPKYIKALVKLLGIKLIIIIDSLKAKSESRIGTTIELTTNFFNNEINKRTMKCDIISIGMPTIVDMKKTNESTNNLIISIQDIDEVVENASSLISIAINKYF